MGMLIPNPLQGRLCFAYIAGAMLLIGGLLYSGYLKGMRRDLETAIRSAENEPVAVPECFTPVGGPLVEASLSSNQSIVPQSKSDE
jgi:hypothetical protein